MTSRVVESLVAGIAHGIGILIGIGAGVVLVWWALL